MYSDDRLSGVELLALYGNDERIGAFLPGLKKVGKVTSGITGGIAKTFLPASMVDSLSKLDPTKKGTITQKVADAKKTANAPSTQRKGNDKFFEDIGKKMMEPNAKNIMIIAGSGIGALILLKILLSSHK